MPQHRPDVPARHQVERAGDQLGVGQRLLVAHLAGAFPNLGDPLSRVRHPDGNVEAHQPDSVATHAVVLGAQVDRHGQVQIADRHPVLVVVAAQSAGHPGDEGVVERTAGPVGGVPQRRHRHLVHAEPAHQGPLLHQRRAGLGHRPHRAVHRCSQFAGRGRGLQRPPDGVEKQLRSGLHGLDDRRTHQADVVSHRVAVAVERLRGRNHRLGGQVAHRARLLGEVEQGHRDLHAAHAVGEGVVELAQHRGAAVVESLDQGGLPHRAGPVEVVHRGQPGHLQHALDGARLRRRDPAHMEVEIEVRGVLPPRRRGRQRLHHPLPEHRQFAADDVEALPDQIPVRRAVEQYHGHHGGSQPRIGLHRPGERVGVSHEFSHRGLRHEPTTRCSTA